MFWLGIGLQTAANLMLGFGGLLLAFYTLPDEPRHEIRRLLIKRLTWSLVFLAFGFFVLVPFVVPWPNLFFDVGILSDELDAIFTACIKQNYDDLFRASLHRLTSGDVEEMEAAVEAVSSCFLDRSGQQMPDQPGKVSYRLIFSNFSVGRLGGVAASIFLLIIVLLSFKDWFLSREPTPGAIANCFSAVVIGVMVQIFLQGAGNLFSN